jgi:hypothetical protein
VGIAALPVARLNSSHADVALTMMLRGLALGGLMVLGGACADPVSSHDVAGVYASSGRNLDLWAESLPADGFEYQIIADTVVLERNQTGVYVAAWRRRALSSGDTTGFQSRVRFTYDLVGTQVTPTRTDCEGECSREPLLGSFEVVGAELRSSVYVFVSYPRISRDTP